MLGAGAVTVGVDVSGCGADASKSSCSLVLVIMDMRWPDTTASNFVLLVVWWLAFLQVVRRSNPASKQLRTFGLS